MEGQDFDKALGRIISTLIALAALAERASGACYPVRCLVLLLLRAAEAVAGNFVREVAQMPSGIADCPAFPQDNSFTALLRLAMRFRSLAAVLGQMLRQPRRFAQDTLQGDSAADARPVVHHRYEQAPALPGSGGLPGSRAPPLPYSSRAGRRYSRAETAVWSALARLVRQRRSPMPSL